MDEKEKNYIDHTEENVDKSQDERTFELDISDVDQTITNGDESGDSAKSKKKGWRGLLAFTLTVTAICAVSIFLLTSVFQGSFLLRKSQEEPQVKKETVDSEKQDSIIPAQVIPDEGIEIIEEFVEPTDVVPPLPVPAIQAPQTPQEQLTPATTPIFDSVIRPPTEEPEPDQNEPDLD